MSTPGGWAAPGADGPDSPSSTPPSAPEPAPNPGGGMPHPPGASQQTHATHTAPPHHPGAPGAGHPPGYPPHPGAAPGWPPPGQPPVVTYQPGVIPFRPLNLGDIYSATFKILKGNPASTIGVAFIIVFLALLPSTPLGAWLSSQAVSDFLDPTAPLNDGSGADVVLVVGGQYLPVISGALATILLAGFIAYVTGQAVLGRKVKLPETWRGTKGHLLRVAGVSFLIWIIFTAALLAFVAPGLVMILLGVRDSNNGLIAWGVVILVLLVLLLVVVYLWLWTRLAFAAPAVVLERVGIGQALKRSWQLTGGRGFWRILGIRLLTALIISFAAQILALPLSMVLMAVTALGTVTAGTLLVGQVIVTALVTLITGALTTPVSATVDTVLYVDERMRREALDVQLIQAVEGRGPFPWQAAHDPNLQPAA